MDAVQDVKPSIHCFGHFHNCGGNQQKIGSTCFLNVAKSPQVVTLSERNSLSVETSDEE
jgi:hypothetical protein